MAKMCSRFTSDSVKLSNMVNNVLYCFIAVTRQAPLFIICTGKVANKTPPVTGRLSNHW